MFVLKGCSKFIDMQQLHGFHRQVSIQKMQ
jgi:hypothetical protein